MTTFASTAWDRLIAPLHAAPGQPDPTRLSLAQYKRVIARDLEVLLNTRVAIATGELDAYPACKESILHFGLADFAQLCLSSSEDRKHICDLLTTAIVRHEPRLTDVRAQLVDEAGVVNRLSFAISGQLRVQADEGVVQFDIMLEPSSLHYSIR